MTLHRGDPWHTTHIRRQQSTMSTPRKPTMKQPNTMQRTIMRLLKSERRRLMNTPLTRTAIRRRRTGNQPLTCRPSAHKHPDRRGIGQGVCRLKMCFLRQNYNVNLPFEQQRFYNPHHHPGMPRTLQSFGLRAGHGEDYSRIHYDQGCASSVGTSDSGSSGDTFEMKIY